MKKDIENSGDVRLLVDTFYDKVKLDPLIGPIFIGVIRDKWPSHLQKMYRFWQTVLLHEHTYSGSPFPPHARLPLEQQHFDRWLSNWRESVDLYFKGNKANEAKLRGERIAAIFLSKIDYYRHNSDIQRRQ